MILTQQQGYVFLALFGIAMFLITKYFAKSKNKDDFLVANRDINWFYGGMSIAASWIWAPALFISVSVAYDYGLAGVFWFTVPNMVALVIFAFIGPKIKKMFPKGYTLPEWIKFCIGPKAHRVFLFPFFFYQLMAIVVQLFIGGQLIYSLTSIPLYIVMPLLLVIALSYTLVSGLRASIITDVVQMSLILVVLALVIPVTLKTAPIIIENNILDPAIAFSFGIVTSIGLIAGAISDQQYWQRCFAIKDVKKSFIFGALIFGLVPLSLSSLGFIGRTLGMTGEMIGVQVVSALVPQLSLLFVVMLLAGLTSTLDSGLAAFSSLWAVDMHGSPKKAMVLVGIVGLIVAYLLNFTPLSLQHLWWIFNTIAACILVPTIMSLYRKLDERRVVYSVSIAFFIGVPLFVYANVVGSSLLQVLSFLFVVGVSLFSLKKLK